MSIEKEKKHIKKQNKTGSMMKKIRTLLLASMLGFFPISEALGQNNNTVSKEKPTKEEKMRQKEAEKDSLWFEWQKEHFDAADKRDLKRDIIVLYYDTITDTYWTKYIYKYSKNKHGRKEISKNEYENPNKLRTDYNRQYPAEHILVVDEKDEKLDYKEAKAILDQQRIEAKKEKEEQKKKK